MALEHYHEMTLLQLTCLLQSSFQIPGRENWTDQLVGHVYEFWQCVPVSPHHHVRVLLRWTRTWSLGDWLWARSHCSLCLLDKEWPFHPAPNNADPEETVDEGKKESGVSWKFWFWPLYGSLPTTALYSSGRTGPSSPVLLTQPHSEAGLLAPVPFLSIVIKLALMQESRA